MPSAEIGTAARAAGSEALSYSARLIGPFDLVSSAGDSVMPRGRRACALLAYLILGPPHDAARDTLAALLWSERGDEQARASLRQTLLELRPLVGPGRLVTVTRTSLRLNDEALTTDLGRFDQAAERGDVDGLIAAFGEADATLLVGMRDLDGAFDEWLAQRRSLWLEKRRAVALQACQSETAARTPALALRLAHLVALADPLDEAATVAVMTLANRTGDIATVRRAFATLAQALRRDLNVAPSAATVSTYQSLVASVDRPSATEPVAPLAAQRPFLPPPRQAPRRRRLIALGFMAAAGVSVASLVKGVLVTGTAPGSGARHAVIDTDASVVTFQPLVGNPGDLRAQEVNQGLQSAIVRHLTGSVTPVQIVDRVRAGETGGMTIRGNTLASRDGLRADIQLVANPSGKVVWAGSFSRPARELDQLEEQISIQIARELHCAYADGRQAYVDRDPELARLSLSHCDTLGRDSDEAVHYDWQITRRAPTFARGWAEYAMDAALIAEDMPPRLQAQGFVHATSLARHALALDPHQGLAYAALAVASQERPWPERLALVRAGLVADPTSPELHLRQGFLLAALGRQQEALGETTAAYRYDHLLPAKLINRALAELASGYVDLARDDLALGRTYWPGLRALDNIVVALGIVGVDPGPALTVVKARERYDADPAYAGLAAFLAWRLHPTPRNRLAAARAITDAAARGQGTGSDIRLLALLGRFDDAYRIGKDSPRVTVDPGWFNADLAAFRRDPRFMRLMQRAGIVAAWQQTGLWPDFCTELGGIRECEHAVRTIR